MRKTITKEELYADNICYDRVKRDACSFMSNDSFSAITILESEVPIIDKVYYISKILTTSQERVQLLSDIKASFFSGEEDFINKVKTHRFINGNTHFENIETGATICCACDYLISNGTPEISIVNLFKTFTNNI